MKKGIAFILTLVCVCSLLGCGKETPQEEVVVGGDLIPQVMVDGIIYADMNTESTATNRADGFDGEITSKVPQSQQPTENDQSNFGTGYGYQFGEREGTLELYINGKWWIFATEKVRYQMHYPERFLNLTEPPVLSVSTLGEEVIEAKKISMDWHGQSDAATDTLMSANRAAGSEGNVPVLKLEGDLLAFFYWEVPPDQVYLRYWGEDQETDCEFVQITTSDAVGLWYDIHLQDGDFHYEVRAVWEDTETYGGECYYQFRTEK